MSRDDSAVRLRHMLDYAREAVALAQGKSRADLDTDRLLNLALVHLVTLVGEAANHVSAEVQSQHALIAWPLIISMRNRLIHGYDIVDFDILWQTIVEDLPPLISALEEIVTLD
ncbi:MAG: HepT-like ribonuclease domain-containing protein [Anaerolineales bacterium]